MDSASPDPVTASVASRAIPDHGGFDANGAWHDGGNGRFAKPGWSTAKAAMLRAIRGVMPRDHAMRHRDRHVDLTLHHDTDRALIARLHANPARAVSARYHSDRYAEVGVNTDDGPRRVLVPWAQFADPTPTVQGMEPRPASETPVPAQTIRTDPQTGVTLGVGNYQDGKLVALLPAGSKAERRYAGGQLGEYAYKDANGWHVASWQQKRVTSTDPYRSMRQPEYREEVGPYRLVTNDEFGQTTWEPTFIAERPDGETVTIPVEPDTEPVVDPQWYSTRIDRRKVAPREQSAIEPTFVIVAQDDRYQPVHVGYSTAATYEQAVADAEVAFPGAAHYDAGPAEIEDAPPPRAVTTERVPLPPFETGVPRDLERHRVDVDGVPAGEIRLSPTRNWSAVDLDGNSLPANSSQVWGNANGAINAVAATVPTRDPDVVWPVNAAPVDTVTARKLAPLFDDPVVADIMGRYQSDGHPVYIVGGAVRSVLSDQTPNDIDLTTSATPEQSTRVLNNVGTVYPLGEKFGTVVVNVDGMDYEVTTHRTEQYDPASRKPEVAFTVSLDDDLARRDFTVNAMAVTADRKLIDPFNGQQDISDQIIRAVGDPDERFSEDPLRIIRAVRFASTLGFTIDPATVESARRNAGRLTIVSPERVRTELDKIMRSDRPDAVEQAVRWANTMGITDVLFGPLANAARRTMQENRVQFFAVPPSARFAALVHDAHVNDGVDPMSLISLMRRNRSEIRDIAKISAAAIEIRSSTDVNPDVATRLAVRKLNDAQLETLRHVDPSLWTTKGYPSALAKAYTDRQRLRAPLPLSGQDLVDMGLRGPEISDAVTRLTREFAARNGKLPRQVAVALASPARPKRPAMNMSIRSYPGSFDGPVEAALRERGEARLVVANDRLRRGFGVSRGDVMLVRRDPNSVDYGLAPKPGADGSTRMYRVRLTNFEPEVRIESLHNEALRWDTPEEFAAAMGGVRVPTDEDIAVFEALRRHLVDTGQFSFPDGDATGDRYMLSPWKLRRAAEETGVPADVVNRIIADREVMWHATPTGDVHAAANYGLHVGPYTAAVGVGRMPPHPTGGRWDGTVRYDGTVHTSTGPVSGDLYPDVFPLFIVGPMLNDKWAPVGDNYANSRMAGQITRGETVTGYYYLNHAEDPGNVSAVLPDGSWVVKRHTVDELETIWHAAHGTDAPTDERPVTQNLTLPGSYDEARAAHQLWNTVIGDMRYAGGSEDSSEADDHAAAAAAAARAATPPSAFAAVFAAAEKLSEPGRNAFSVPPPADTMFPDGNLPDGVEFYMKAGFSVVEVKSPRLEDTSSYRMLTRMRVAAPDIPDDPTLLADAETELAERRAGLDKIPEKSRIRTRDEYVLRSGRALVANMFAGWGESSLGFQTSVAQRAVADEFGITYRPDPRIGPEVQADIDVLYEAAPEAWRAHARAVYNETQRVFAEKGITEAVLFRGVADPNRDQKRRPDLYPGDPKPEPFDGPVTSWSVSPNIASSFGDVKQSTVPVGDIFATPLLSGIGVSEEGEVLVLARPRVTRPIGRTPDGEVVSDDRMFDMWFDYDQDDVKYPPPAPTSPTTQNMVERPVGEGAPIGDVVAVYRRSSAASTMPPTTQNMVPQTTVRGYDPSTDRTFGNPDPTVTPYYHLSLTGRSPEALRYVHLGPTGAEGLSRLKQTRDALADPIDAPIVSKRILHGKPLDPEMFRVLLSKPPMNHAGARPDSDGMPGVVPDTVANLLTDPLTWVPPAEAATRGWDGSPDDIVPFELDGDMVAVPATRDEWVSRIEAHLDHIDRVVALDKTNGRSTHDDWFGYNEDTAKSARLVWNKIGGDPDNVGALYYRNTGEVGSGASLVAPRRQFNVVVPAAPTTQERAVADRQLKLPLRYKKPVPPARPLGGDTHSRRLTVEQVRANRRAWPALAPLWERLTDDEFVAMGRHWLPPGTHTRNEGVGKAGPPSVWARAVSDAVTEIALADLGVEQQPDGLGYPPPFAAPRWFLEAVAELPPYPHRDSWRALSEAEQRLTDTLNDPLVLHPTRPADRAAVIKALSGLLPNGSVAMFAPVRRDQIDSVAAALRDVPIEDRSHIRFLTLGRDSGGGNVVAAAGPALWPGTGMFSTRRVNALAEGIAIDIQSARLLVDPETWAERHRGRVDASRSGFVLSDGADSATSLRLTVLHEIGHAVDYAAMSGLVDGKLSGVVDAMQTDGGHLHGDSTPALAARRLVGVTTTPYGATSPMEAFAEAYAMHRSGVFPPDAEPFRVQIAEAVEARAAEAAAAPPITQDMAVRPVVNIDDFDNADTPATVAVVPPAVVIDVPVDRVARQLDDTWVSYSGAQDIRQAARTQVDGVTVSFDPGLDARVDPILDEAFATYGVPDGYDPEAPRGETQQAFDALQARTLVSRVNASPPTNETTWRAIVVNEESYQAMMRDVRPGSTITVPLMSTTSEEHVASRYGQYSDGMSTVMVEVDGNAPGYHPPAAWTGNAQEYVQGGRFEVVEVTDTVTPTDVYESITEAEQDAGYEPRLRYTYDYHDTRVKLRWVAPTALRPSTIVDSDGATIDSADTAPPVILPRPWKDRPVDVTTPQGKFRIRTNGTVETLEWNDPYTRPDRRTVSAVKAQAFRGAAQNMMDAAPATQDMAAAPYQVGAPARPQTRDRIVRAHQSAILDAHSTIDPDVAPDVEEFTAEVADALRSRRADGDPVIRVPWAAAIRIAEERRFKSQHETGTSSAMYGPASRAASEWETMGVPVDIRPEHRPIFGVIEDPYEEAAYGADMYGPVTFVLKPGVFERSTMSFGDSGDLDVVPVRSAGDVPDSEVLAAASQTAVRDAAGLVAADYNGDDMYEPGDMTESGFYRELQIHGGVTLDDVADVVFDPEDRDSPDAVRAIEALTIAGFIPTSQFMASRPERPMATAPPAPDGFDPERLDPVARAMYEQLAGDPVQQVQASPMYQGYMQELDNPRLGDSAAREIEALETAAIADRDAALTAFYRSWQQDRAIRTSIAPSTGDPSTTVAERADVTTGELEALLVGQAPHPIVFTPWETIAGSAATATEPAAPTLSAADMVDGVYMDSVARASEALLALPLADTAGRGYGMYGAATGTFDAGHVADAADILHGLVAHTRGRVGNAEPGTPEWGGYVTQTQPLTRAMSVPPDSPWLTPRASVRAGLSFWTPRRTSGDETAVYEGWGAPTGRNVPIVLTTPEGEPIRVYQIPDSDEVVTAGQFRVNFIDPPNSDRPYYRVQVEQTAVLEPAILTNRRFRSAATAPQPEPPKYLTAPAPYPATVRVVGGETQDDPNPERRSRVALVAESLSDIRKAAQHVRSDRIEVAVPPVAVTGIMVDGRLRSQHETGYSRGMFSPQRRRDAETLAFRLNPDTPDADMPIYGQITDAAHVTVQYGAISLRMRPDVADRTTVTFNDSLTLDPARTVAPLRFDRIAEASDSDLVRASHAGFRRHGDYIEAQIHGGVDIYRDVAAIVVRSDSDVEIPSAMHLAAHLGFPTVIVAQNLRGELSPAKAEAQRVAAIAQFPELRGITFEYEHPQRYAGTAPLRKADMTGRELLPASFNIDDVRALLRDGSLTDTQRAELRSLLDTLEDVWK